MVSESYTCLMFDGRMLSVELGISMEMPCDGRMPVWTSKFALSSAFEAIAVESSLNDELASTRLKAHGSQVKSQSQELDEIDKSYDTVYSV